MWLRSSAPIKARLFHSPPRRERSARGMWRARDMSSAKACSAAAMVLPRGAFTTTMPRSVAASRSTLSTPVPARAMIWRRPALERAAAVDLRLAAYDQALVVREGLAQVAGGEAGAHVDMRALPQQGDTFVGDRIGDENAWAGARFCHVVCSWTAGNSGSLGMVLSIPPSPVTSRYGPRGQGLRHRKSQAVFQGLITGTSRPSKSPTLRVATARSWAMAVPAMRASARCSTRPAR